MLGETPSLMKNQEQIDCQTRCETAKLGHLRPGKEFGTASEFLKLRWSVGLGAHKTGSLSIDGTHMENQLSIDETGMDDSLDTDGNVRRSLGPPMMTQSPLAFGRAERWS